VSRGGWPPPSAHKVIAPASGLVSRWSPHARVTQNEPISTHATVGIAAVLYARGERASTVVIHFGRRLGGDRGETAVRLAGQAIRGVALGVVVTTQRSFAPCRPSDREAVRFGHVGGKLGRIGSIDLFGQGASGNDTGFQRRGKTGPTDPGTDRLGTVSVQVDKYHVMFWFENGWSRLSSAQCGKRRAVGAGFAFDNIARSVSFCSGDVWNWMSYFTGIMMCWYGVPGHMMYGFDGSSAVVG
jgi:hypothetical protein